MNTNIMNTQILKVTKGHFYVNYNLTYVLMDNFLSLF